MSEVAIPNTQLCLILFDVILNARVSICTGEFKQSLILLILFLDLISSHICLHT